MALATRILLLLLVTVPLAACGGQGMELADGSSADDALADEEDVAGKEDSSSRPLGTYQALTGGDPGKLKLLVLRSDKTFHRETNCRAAPCTPPKEDGKYTLTKSRSTKYIRFITSSGTAIDRYSYQLAGNTLDVRKVGVNEGSIRLTHSAATTGWCAVPAECDRQGLTKQRCPGAWSCEANACNYACTSPGAPAQYVLGHPAPNESLLNGPLVGGGELQVKYDGRRLRNVQGCVGAQGSASGTTIKMSYMFNDDSSRIATETVETYSYSRWGQGCAGICEEIKPFEPVISLPAEARRIAMWFYCVPSFSGGAESNWKYDSNNGRNYVLSINAP